MKKMDLKLTLLFFGLPGLQIYLSYMFLLPNFLESGMSMFWGIFICTWVGIIIMTGMVLYLWKQSEVEFKKYFWFNKLSKKQWGLVGVGIFVVQVGEALTGATRTFLSKVSYFQAPDFFPELFKPNYEIKLPLESFLGENLSGNYMILVLWSIWLIVNIACEELLWRGYALPRMEKHFGRWAWLVNGIFWNIGIHYFMRWSFIAMLPVSLIVPYLCQKTKSMWPGIVIHGIGNALVFAILIPSIIK